MSSTGEAALSLVLLGNPNCGKTALFNLLTGSRQKVANYPGVTVDRKEGQLTTPAGRQFRLLDLPGAYSLNAASIDEEITRDVVLGALAGEQRPDMIVCVSDATNLKLNLRLVLEVKRLGLPMMLALNMTDLARKRGITIDVAALQRELDMPVVNTVAVRRGGASDLLAELESAVPAKPPGHAGARPPAAAWLAPDAADVTATQREVRRILAACVREPAIDTRFDERIDRVVLHPVWGLLILAATLFLMFQAVFSWARLPMEMITAGVGAFGEFLGTHMPESLLRSLLVDGIVAGVGGVLVFLPQILILFLFILALEDSGYLPRAAFLLDRLMGTVGLSGRSFIPLLSSFACAIPGIMAARTISNWRDRLATIMIAPLMTCSARLPVYALIIGAFIPQTMVGVFNLQGLVLFALYVAGVVSAMAVAAVLKMTVSKGLQHPLLLELPSYRLPHGRNLLLGLLERAKIFLLRVGNIILALTVLLWFLSTFPGAPEGASGPAIQYSYAGMLGQALEVIFAPIGFNWQISIALVPGMAAREVAVGALGTVYALSATGDDVAGQLGPLLAASWSLPTAFSLLAWFVFAPQCLATLAAVKRETNSWRYPLLMAGYLFTLAYLASFVTYRVALVLTGGGHA
ncbi:MAG: Ferrous iron transport protein B [Candidatus Accumulibacter regalis]|jgi:ferrous iron transport protein B|uniref:Fe(2+) transporter FeoB n=1 Tax=Accumulibacter regalis TaxID=522306 RepID=A0A011R8N4_ACCRE|nr:MULTISPECIES: ferrous iron transporter B [unclassified Candidatus Accumulibacter]EXI87489.1 MAG: Ferrous iron transport protein B [Candidatus Accumulibacter regalis]MQM35899.1 ferrous iron transporter B [Candidatus Accumulibacter phosphatis]MBL8369634.1 ferrous iron transporter B [Accumulibacter sp.]HRE70802.1 ferrous iron transporter B [Accumulibacter sp.]HRE85902.1 ferrous iron transporter B [Accumulibacter sp.]